jgi:hypothetical protein
MPSKPLKVEIDCEKFEQQQLQEEYFINPDEF